MRSTTLKSIVYFMAILFSTSSVVLADDGALMARINGLEKTMSQMQRVIDKQNTKLSALEGRPVRDEGYVAPSTEVPKWLNDLKFKADFRLRYEARTESSGCTVGTTPGCAAGSKGSDRNRFRYRLRFGFEKGFKGPFEDDKMKVGFRLVSAPNTARDSTNTTLDTQFTFKDISIDQAYASYYPAWATMTNSDGIGLTGTEITAGKFKNPFLKGSTWALWDSDVTPEGAYEQFEFALLKSEEIDIENTATIGQLILEEGGGQNHDDAELYAYQTVFESKLKVIDDMPIKMKNAISWYDFVDFSTKAGNFGAAGNNSTSLSGTGGLASDFDVINVYNEIGIPFDLVPGAKGFKVYFDWFNNVGAGGTSSELNDEDNAWMIGAKLGSAKKKGDWELKYEYASIEANASPDVFNDSDFGGTDRNGSVIKGKYKLTDNLAFAVAAFFTNRISADTAATVDQERNLYQMDLVWKF